MTPWVSKSSRVKQTAAAVGFLVVGGVLIVALRGASDPQSNAFAGLLLGVVLAGLGVVGVLMSSEQTTVVDPSQRRITVAEKTYLRTKTRTIAFDEISGTSIGYLGKKSNFVTYYYLMLELRSGEQYPLFGPGRFYPGASQRATVEGWQRRLEGYLAGRAE